MVKGIIVSAFIIGLVSSFGVRKNQDFDLKASIARGKDLYVTFCLTCHGENGEGVEGLYPPLAKSDYMMKDDKRSIQQILYGVEGEMTVNGKVYNTPMEKIDLTDEQTSDILNYSRNSWGNKGDAIKPEDVKKERKN